MNEIRFIDLFGGIGGFHLGLERANTIIRSAQQKNNKECNNPKNKLDNRKLFSCVEKAPSKRDKKSRTDSANTNRKLSTQRRSKPTFNCVWYCDKDKYATQTYNKNFKENHKPTDITTVNPTDIPDFDMFCAGFPCQSFSIAGKRKGFQDIRGTMFFEIYRIAQAKRPRLLFLENVKGLLSADDGRCFGTILTSLDELGYDCEWQVLNSKNFGVPQNRERVFIIGHLRGSGSRQVFPLGQTGSEYVKELIYKGAIMSEQNKKWLENGKQLSRNFPQGQRVYSVDGIASNICGDSGGLGYKTGLYQINPTVRSSGRGSLERHKWDIIKTNKQIRRLTPIECERLQGFPDNWTNGISDTQRYKQLGNAVTVNVIQAIGENLN